MSKIYVCIDVQQLFLASREEFDKLARVDYVKLKNIWTKDDTETEVMAYVIVSPHHEDFKFVRLLKNNGFKVMRQVASYDIDRNDSSVRIVPKNWTGRMVRDIHVEITKNIYDHYYIISGCGQFLSAVHAIHAQGKKVTVVSFNSSLQNQLKKEADEVIVLNEEYLYDESKYKKTLIPSFSGEGGELHFVGSDLIGCETISGDINSTVTNWTPPAEYKHLLETPTEGKDFTKVYFPLNKKE